MLPIEPQGVTVTMMMMMIRLWEAEMGLKWISQSVRMPIRDKFAINQNLIGPFRGPLTKFEKISDLIIECQNPTLRRLPTSQH